MTIKNGNDIITVILDICNKYNIDYCNLLVVGGSASLIHGLRATTNDIDVELDVNEFWKTVDKLNLVVTELSAKGTHLATNLFSLDGVDFIMSTNNNLEQYEYNGLKILSKQGLLAYRLSLSREKDLSDITLLSMKKE